MSESTLLKLHPMLFSWETLTLIRYWVKLILATEPVSLPEEPSTRLAILILALDIWRISLMLAPWCLIVQPIKLFGMMSTWRFE